MMGRVWTIARRELRSYFDTPTAYVLIVAFLGMSLFLSFRGSISLTETLTVNAVGSMDMLTGIVNSPIIDISKRIHEWNLSLKWVPSGFNRGFFLRFGAASPQLQGLEYRNQNTPLYR